GGLAGRLRDLLGRVLADPVVGHPAMDRDVHLLRDLRELDRVVRVGPDGLAEVLADLRAVDVEGARELDVRDVIAAEVDVHETGHRLRGISVRVVVDALHERVRAVADADDRDAHLLVLVAGAAVGGRALRRDCVSVSVSVRSQVRSLQDDEPGSRPEVRPPGATSYKGQAVCPLARSSERTWKMRCRTVMVPRAAST